MAIGCNSYWVVWLPWLQLSLGMVTPFSLHQRPQLCQEGFSCNYTSTLYSIIFSPSSGLEWVLILFCYWFLDPAQTTLNCPFIEFSSLKYCLWLLCLHFPLKLNWGLLAAKKRKYFGGWSLRVSIILFMRARTNRKCVTSVMASTHFEKWHGGKIPLLGQLSPSVDTTPIFWVAELVMRNLYLFLCYFSSYNIVF